MRARITIAALAALALTLPGGAAAPAVAGPATPFSTDVRPYLVPLASGVDIVPLISAGDVLGGGVYQMSGIPDGLGWYQSSGSTIELFVNHEFDGRPSWARVSQLTLDTDGGVLAGSYVIDGTERFEDFCSSTLAEFGGHPWYFTGEESPFSKRQGVSVAVNASTGAWKPLPWFGHFYHENQVPVRGMSQLAFFLSEDGHPGRSQIYAYTADSLRAASHGDGTLRTFVPDGPTDGSPSPKDIVKGETLAGHLQRIPQGSNSNPIELDRATSATGAMGLIRIEDAVADPHHPGVVYFSDTGAGRLASGQETRAGRIYRFTMDPADPTNATLEVVLDGDTSDDMINPDNLGIAGRSLVIQEDHNNPKYGYDRVLVYDTVAQTLRTVARTDPSQHLIDVVGGPGFWESSGVVDASDWFGPGWWLLTVQAGEQNVRQPGLDGQVDSAIGEGGQILKVYIPGT
ncbi:MAG: hypothetical protein M3O84_06540 [Actinomycetota bacterium]|nr:hypothetical protein [Actinomycetota bacterium]